ncbi:beta-glucosidase 12-like [Cucurbita pepo subsp. pepo]|uniref:beta-glucosidase 12-like n=1 Tax=Cucurbita pepo subsp. pepo TaxID=3664 RepID=UPI000C9D2AED|nr:beta-glucosidase 12-like [Cucurbita pepo subsp. pepo]
MASVTDTDSSQLILIRRSNFPEDFVFGAASSAYQYEGAVYDYANGGIGIHYGKGLSIWDTFTKNHPERVVDHSNGDKAVDEYHRYKEDVALMKDIGFDVYRFSIAWSRIFPTGKLCGGVNQQGVGYYHNLIDEMLANGIKPYVTLFHWDVPQDLETEYGGFLNLQIVDDFRDFAEFCFKEYGQKVKHWITLNEPVMFASKGYGTGELAPGRGAEWDPSRYLGGNSGTEPYTVGHHLILAHAAAANLYKTKYQADQKGEIGITLASTWYIPYSDSEEDNKARDRAYDFSLGWMLHPIVYGDYPQSMRDLVGWRLPKFTKDETTFIMNSFDFLGINYYTANYAKHNPNSVHRGESYLNDIHATLSTDRDGISIGPKADPKSWIAVYPEGIQDLLIYIKDNYHNPVIYITENGYLDFDSPNAKHLIRDEGRAKYIHDHLIYILKALKDGVRVRGYFAWSLLDNFEWARGYTMRFGLIFVDFNKNLMRIPKDSSKWFHHFLKT